jgi:hypothetical protein
MQLPYDCLLARAWEFGDDRIRRQDADRPIDRSSITTVHDLRIT